MREGGKQSLTPLYRGGQKGFNLGKRRGGKKSLMVCILRCSGF